MAAQIRRKFFTHYEGLRRWHTKSEVEYVKFSKKEI